MIPRRAGFGFRQSFFAFVWPHIGPGTSSSSVMSTQAEVGGDWPQDFGRHTKAHRNHVHAGAWRDPREAESSQSEHQGGRFVRTKKKGFSLILDSAAPPLSFSGINSKFSVTLVIIRPTSSILRFSVPQLCRPAFNLRNPQEMSNSSLKKTSITFEISQPLNNLPNLVRSLPKPVQLPLSISLKLIKLYLHLISYPLFHRHIEFRIRQYM